MSKPIIERNIDVPLDVLKELLTSSEWRMVKQRLLIIKLLGEGLSIRQIAERAQVGTDTVVRMSRKVETSPELRKLAGRGGSEGSSKWVFGQVSSEKY